MCLDYQTKVVFSPPANPYSFVCILLIISTKAMAPTLGSGRYKHKCQRTDRSHSLAFEQVKKRLIRAGFKPVVPNLTTA